MILELIDGSYGYGILLNDMAITGHHGGGVMHTVLKFRVSQPHLEKALEKAGYKLVEIDQVKKGEKNETQIYTIYR